MAPRYFGHVRRRTAQSGQPVSSTSARARLALAAQATFTILRQATDVFIVQLLNRFDLHPVQAIEVCPPAQLRRIAIIVESRTYLPSRYSCCIWETYALHWFEPYR